MGKLVDMLLCGIALATALYVLLPMAIFGGVTHVEPNAYIRWGEFGGCMVCVLMGAVHTVVRGTSCRRQN